MSVTTVVRVTGERVCGEVTIPRSRNCATVMIENIMSFLTDLLGYTPGGYLFLARTPVEFAGDRAYKGTESVKVLAPYVKDPDGVWRTAMEKAEVIAIEWTETWA